MEPTSLTLTEAAALIAGRQLSPLELTRACLERIERFEPQINSFITLTADSALEQARRAEAEIARGEYRGVLHGIPVALKDSFATKGVRTTAGSAFLADWIPTEDATTVRQLTAAGAVLLGKLNMHEWAWGTTNINPHYGDCNNPWDTAHVAGGSSGGAAAALAAGFCFGALGSDTGGSIRTPAAFCGVVGLKATYGRVSLQGVTPLSWALDHAGPMARTVRDAAELLGVLAVYDPADPASSRQPAADYTAQLDQGVRGWRVAVLDASQFPETDPEVWAAVTNAAEVFASLGAEIIETELPGLRDARQANRVISAGDALAFHRQRLDAEPERFGADVLERLRDAETVTAEQYARARQQQGVARRQLEGFFDSYDILLSPAAPVAAPLRRPPLGEEAVRTSISLFAAPFNLTGLPALSVPCGFTSGGLPIGLQIAAGPWQEARLLQAGNAFEAATDWHLRKPEL
jgi:aspartyl-tRNA(Asn)/glutamyl-tRNA(Gln) amidotransferase subunit A